MFPGPVKVVFLPLFSISDRKKKPKIQKIIHKYPKNLYFFLIIAKYRTNCTIYLFKATKKVHKQKRYKQFKKFFFEAQLSSALRRRIVDSPRPRHAAISAVLIPASVQICILSFSSIETSFFLTILVLERIFRAATQRKKYLSGQNDAADWPFKLRW